MAVNPGPALCKLSPLQPQKGSIMQTHPIDAWQDGTHVGLRCDQCVNHADVVIEEAGTLMAVCFDCAPQEG